MEATTSKQSFGHFSTGRIIFNVIILYIRGVKFVPVKTFSSWNTSLHSTCLQSDTIFIFIFPIIYLHYHSSFILWLFTLLSLLTMYTFHSQAPSPSPYVLILSLTVTPFIHQSHLSPLSLLPLFAVLAYEALKAHLPRFAQFPDPDPNPTQTSK